MYMVNIKVFFVQLIFFFCLMFLFSCASSEIFRNGDDGEQVKAENRIMKKNLTLALRENSVLKDENFQYKNDNISIRSKIRLAESEIHALKKKNELDLALFNQKYEKLEKEYSILEAEGTLRINKLAAANKTLEEKIAIDTAEFRKILKKQEEEFNIKRAAIEKDFIVKDTEYKKELERLDAAIINANINIESLKKKLSESDAEVKSAKTEILKKEEINRELKRTINRLTALIERKNDISSELNTGN